MNSFALFQPIFLWALLFAGIVLAIHLLRKNKTIKLDFSTLRFFKTTALQAKRTRKLRRLLLLFIRLGIIITIVLLFAGPYSKKNPLTIFQNPQATLFTWVDPTMSMSYTQKDKSIESNAFRYIDTLLRKLPATVKHYQFDYTQHAFVQGMDHQPNLQTQYGPAKLKDVFQSFNEIKSHTSLPLLVLFSDFQLSTASELDSQLSNYPPSLPILCVDLKPADPWNYSLREVDITNDGSVSVMLTAQGKPLTKGSVSFSARGMRIGQANCSLGSFESTLVHMEVTDDIRGIVGEVQILNQDPLSFDNLSCFTKREDVSERVLIAGEPSVNKVISAALSAAGPMWNPIVAKDGNAITYEDLDSADCIIVNQLSMPSKALQAFVDGSIPGKKTVIFTYATEEPSAGWHQELINRLIPSSQKNSIKQSQRALSPILPDTITRLWREFRSLRVDEAAIYTYYDNLPGRPMLTLESGASFVSRFEDKNENVWILIGSPIGISKSNNLCETGFYLPFLDRLLRAEAIGGKAVGNKWIAGFKHPNPFFGTGKWANIYTSENSFLAKWVNQPVVMIEKPGIYKITPDGEPSYSIAVLPDYSESECAYSDLAVLQKKKRDLIVLNEKQFNDFLLYSRNSFSYLLWIILGLLILGEVLLWDRFKYN